eukprot:13191061-Heterocapsa_arctica.AAC.1
MRHFKIVPVRKRTSFGPKAFVEVFKGAAATDIELNLNPSSHIERRVRNPKSAIPVDNADADAKKRDAIIMKQSLLFPEKRGVAAARKTG